MWSPRTFRSCAITGEISANAAVLSGLNPKPATVAAGSWRPSLLRKAARLARGLRSARYMFWPLRTTVRGGRARPVGRRVLSQLARGSGCPTATRWPCVGPAAASQTPDDEIERQLDAGEPLSLEAFGDWEPTVPKGMVGLKFRQSRRCVLPADARGRLSQPTRGVSWHRQS